MPVGNLGDGNPPPGFGSPTDDGKIRRLDRDHALYRSSGGEHRILERMDPEPSPRFCG
jgi:hypothetical protein